MDGDTYVSQLASWTLQVAANAGVLVGFGVEITVEWASKEHHLLGYFPTSAWAAPHLTAPMLELQVGPDTLSFAGHVPTSYLSF